MFSYNFLSVSKLMFTGNINKKMSWCRSCLLAFDIHMACFIIHNLCLLQILEEEGPVRGPPLSKEPWLALRLPPASPFDNFLRAARG